MNEREELEALRRLAELEAKAGAAKPPEEKGYIETIGAALGSGTGRVGLGLQHWLGKGIQAVGERLTPDEKTLSTLVDGKGKRGAIQSAGDWLVQDAAQGREKLKGEIAPYKEANPMTAGTAEFAGEVLTTLPVGGGLAAPIKAAAARGVAPAVLTPVANAVASGGMSAGALTGAKGLAVRSLGGAITGGATAGLVDPGSEVGGALIGAALPAVLSGAAKAGRAIGTAARPFTAKGQDKIVGNTLREFAQDSGTRSALSNAAEVIPGSAPTTAAASGDIGLAGLSRTLQSANPQYANELAGRQFAQNAARSAAIEEIAGTTGKIAAAKEARDTATAAMRESALDSAGLVNGQEIITKIDNALTNPGNAGRISQQALKNVRDQIASFTDGGKIDARALYAIRKDINDVLEGKLQGEAGNLRYASKQLIAVKGLIDDVIDKAGRQVAAPTGTSLGPVQRGLGPTGAPASGAPRSSWKQYLQEYTKQSVPINQMERLQEVMKRVQTGSVDDQGNLILSAAKLNNLLKNEGADLAKSLAPEQMDLLRRLSADLNASQLATSAGKAVGSDTVQKLGSSGMLQGLTGSRLANSAPMQTLVARPVNWAYKNADQQIMNKLSEAMLDPQLAARLMADPQQRALAELFIASGVPQVGYRAAPVLAAQ